MVGLDLDIIKVGVLGYVSICISSNCDILWCRANTVVLFQCSIPLSFSRSSGNGCFSLSAKDLCSLPSPFSSDAIAVDVEFSRVSRLKLR